MKKLRILFPFVEAGFGHIMPMKSIEETFRRKYGDKVEVISSQFCKESGDPHLIRYEQMMTRQVRLFNRFPIYGWAAGIGNVILGKYISSWIAIRGAGPLAFRAGVRHMEELHPDVLFSTHWATNYYAEHMKKNKPYTVMYCPDARLNPLFEYHADYNMISMPYGYLKALRKKQYTTENMRLVPFLIRNEALQIPLDKKALRKKLNLPENNFTVVLAEGGYGLGKMGDICSMLVKSDLNLTVIPICGKNERLYRRLISLKPNPNVTFLPHRFTEQILEYEAAADLFLGKSGNIVAESTYFENPSIVTNCSTLIEHHIADHYIYTVGSAIKKTRPRDAVALINDFATHPEHMDRYKRAAHIYHKHYGSEKAADALWQKLTEVFPQLLEETPSDPQ